MFASRIALVACWKPFLAACFGLILEFFSASSRTRSKIRMLASTAIPTVRISPAMPGRVSVERRNAMAPMSMTMFATRLMAAKAPRRL